MSRPKITVLMAVYNAADYLPQAVESVLAQTFEDFELLTINDCSTDHSWELLTSFKDSRIRRLENSHNLGAAATRNRGLAEARGEYIAPLDADDICTPDRLEKELTFLSGHSDIGLVASDFHTIDSSGNVTAESVLRRSYSHKDIAWVLYFGNPIAHSTTMYRVELARRAGGYGETSQHGTEDYILWTRLMTRTYMAILPEPLAYYREHGNSLTNAGASTAHQHEAVDVICAFLERQLGQRPSQRHVAFIRGVSLSPAPDASDFLGATNLLMDGFASFLRQFKPDRAERRRAEIRLVELMDVILDPRHNFPADVLWQSGLRIAQHSLPVALLSTGRQAGRAVKRFIKRRAVLLKSLQTNDTQTE